MIKRESNIDLFRIIATVFVIVLHVLGQGGILQNSQNCVAYYVASFLQISAVCAVNCFALISGYLMVNKNIKLKSIIGLWLQVAFYSVVFTALFFAFMPETRTIKNLVVAFFPIISRRWWYISSYFAMFFFIPFLNTAINNISKQTYTKFLLVILIGICVVGCISPIDAFVLNNGYSAIWLIIVYLFGAYIKKYELSKKITALKGLIGFFVMILLTFLSKVIISILTYIVLGEAKYDGIFISYVSITIFLAAVFLFLFCLNIKVGSFASKLIFFISPVSLGVYLIHVHPLVFDFIMKDAFALLTHKSVLIMLLGILAATVLIFVVCAVIELIRIQLFKLVRINKLCEFADKKVNTIYLKVFER